jgi:endoglucanase
MPVSDFHDLPTSRTLNVRLWLKHFRLVAMAVLAAISITLPATVSSAASAAQSDAGRPVTNLDAWRAAKLMGVGVNIGNTLDSTSGWETGWGNPRITKAYIENLAALGFRTVRLPIAWDTYARDARIDHSKLKRVGQIVDWITSAGMFCVVNIHWDGGWIDSDDNRRFRNTYHTFSPDAERKFRSYWSQIATYFADRDAQLVFEALNEETNFEGTGSDEKAYATLARVNQLFIDTVRNSGGHNADRLLIVPGYSTDIVKTTNGHYPLPKDAVPHKLFISVHYYTPWEFAGMGEDSSLGKMQRTWGSEHDLAELNMLFERMQDFSDRNDIPVFVGEFAPNPRKEPASRVRWMLAVTQAALSRNMVPVLWETGQDIARKPPHSPSQVLNQVFQKLRLRP